MNEHQGTVVVNRFAIDEESLVRLLLRAQKECQAVAAGKTLSEGSRSFVQFVERTQRPLAHRVLHKVRGDQHQCEDLVQETYMKVWKGLARFDAKRLGRGGVLAWLLRIARNTAISFARRKRPSVGLDNAGESADDQWSGFPLPACPDPGPAEQAHKNAVAHSLEQAVADLRSDKQTILKMHYLHDLSHKEIARKTGLTLGQVNMKLYSARQEIRQKLEAVVHEPE